MSTTLIYYLKSHTLKGSFEDFVLMFHSVPTSQVVDHPCPGIKKLYTYHDSEYEQVPYGVREHICHRANLMFGSACAAMNIQNYIECWGQMTMKVLLKYRTDLVEGLPTTKNEILGTHYESILEEVATSVVIQGILVPVEGASVEGIEVTGGSKCHCLLLSAPIGCW